MPVTHPTRHLLRAKDLADARYADPLTIGDLAKAARLSPAHFSREFKRAFGESPHQYLLTRRLERAAALLRTTDWSVARICIAVGLTCTLKTITVPAAAPAPSIEASVATSDVDRPRYSRLLGRWITKVER